MPGSIRVGPFADGWTSMSKVAVGRYTAEREFAMSATPDIVARGSLLEQWHVLSCLAEVLVLRSARTGRSR